MASHTSAPLLFRYRDSDNLHGVSRPTAKRLSAALGLDESQVIHYALKQLAKSLLPAYQPDEGPLTARDIKTIQKRAGKASGKSVSSTLFS
jgi:hypothetical protein